ncbi:MAG: hypothetical protein ACPGUV_01215 [Polyangiales bacterium]
MRQSSSHDSFAALAQATEAVRARPGFSAAVMTRVRAEARKQEPWLGWTGRQVRAWWRGTLAAATLVVLVGAWWATQAELGWTEALGREAALLDEAAELRWAERTVASLW